MLVSIKLSPDQIERWVARHFKFKRRSHGNQLAINNPFIDDDDYHFWISTKEDVLTNGPRKGAKGYWVHDFRPGCHQYDGSFLNFVRRYKNITFFEAAADVCGGDAKSVRESFRQIRAGLQNIKEEESEVETIIELPPLSVSFSEKNNTKLREISLNYLNKRRVSENLAIKYGLMYTPSSIVFPYLEYGLLVYWQERSICNKRFNFPDEVKTGLRKTDYLFNFDNVEVSSDLIIVESIFNSISVGDNCVATGGATIVGNQVRKIGYLNPKNVILAPDHDEAGLKSLHDNFFELKDKYPLAYCLPPKDVDWNDLEQQNGLGASRHYIETHTHRLTLSTLLKLAA